MMNIDGLSFHDKNELDSRWIRSVKINISIKHHKMDHSFGQKILILDFFDLWYELLQMEWIRFIPYHMLGLIESERFWVLHIL